MPAMHLPPPALMLLLLCAGLALVVWWGPAPRQTGQDAVAGSTEPMRLDQHNDGDRRYRLGFVIEHNPDNVAQGGSCIFAHLWRKPGETTAGCTAMGDADLEAMLEWLDADKSPRFVLLPQAEHERLAHAWHLPAAHGDAP